MEKLPYEVFKISEPYYQEHANLYLVCGCQVCLLIDTGLGLFDIGDILPQGYRKIFVVNTHAHYDHIGGNHWFPKIYAHPLSVPVLQNPMDHYIALEFLKQKDFEFLPYPGFDVSNYQIQGVPRIKEIRDGVKFNIEGSTFTVIHTPGHSPDSICLYDREEQILISSDTIYRGELYDSLPHSSRTDYIHSLKKLKSLSVKLVFPGHSHNDEILDGNEFNSIVEEAIRKLKIHNNE